MSNIYLTFLIGVILFAPHTLTQAQQLSGAEAAVTDSLELNRVVVTASKIPQSQRETTKPVQIIGRAEIEQNSGRNLSQILNQQSGIRVNDSYGAPSNGRILYMQGAGAANTLVLVDGTPVNDPSGPGGLFDLRLLPTHNIEQIEILKGSQSTLYGTDAVAGVINIITRSGSDQSLSGTGQLGYGSYNSFSGSAGISGSLDETLSYSLNYNRESSDGFSAAERPESAEQPFGDDGFVMDAFYGKVEVNPAENITITPYLNYSRNNGDYDDDAFQDADNRYNLRMVNPGVQILADFGDIRLNGAYSATRTDRTFANSFGENEFEGVFHNADLYGNYRINEYLNILAGINYQDFIIPETEEEVMDQQGNTRLETVPSRDSQILSPYATLYLKSRSGFSAELGFRLNNHSEYGTNSTYSFAPSYHMTEEVKLFGSVTTGFKVPTLDELFGPFGSNPDLEPQKSLYVNGGVEVTLLQERLKMTAQYFTREVDDLIVYASQQYINRDRQNDSGLELSANWLATQHLTLGGWYNYLDGEIRTRDGDEGTVTEENLIRRPANSVGINASVRFLDHGLIRLDGEYNGERTDLFFDPANNFAQEEVTLDAYTLVNVYAEYSVLSGRMTLYGDIKNLLNSDFTEVYGFNTTGTAVKAGLRFNL